MIALVPTPSALSNMIWARQMCFWGVLWSATRAATRRRSASSRAIDIPLRIRQIRTSTQRAESLFGPFRFGQSTRRTGHGCIPKPNGLRQTGTVQTTSHSAYRLLRIAYTIRRSSSPLLGRRFVARIRSVPGADLVRRRSEARRPSAWAGGCGWLACQAPARSPR